MNQILSQKFVSETGEIDPNPSYLVVSDVGLSDNHLMSRVSDNEQLRQHHL